MRNLPNLGWGAGLSRQGKSGSLCGGRPTLRAAPRTTKTTILPHGYLSSSAELLNWLSYFPLLVTNPSPLIQQVRQAELGS